jgi:hypothetical protein
LASDQQAVELSQAVKLAGGAARTIAKSGKNR